MCSPEAERVEHRRWNAFKNENKSEKSRRILFVCFLSESEPDLLISHLLVLLWIKIIDIFLKSNINLFHLCFLNNIEDFVAEKYKN